MNPKLRSDLILLLASIILSLESVFAVLGGWIILHEPLTTRILIGCLLMLAGMVVVQVRGVSAVKKD